MNSDQITKKDIEKFLLEESLGTLAMLKPDGKPDAVGVYYVFEDFKLYTITKKETAKCKNILAHDDVVFVITNLETQTTLKYIGKATIIENNSERVVKLVNRLSKMDAVIENVKNGLPILKRGDGALVLIEIKPISIKLTRYNADDYQEHVITL